MPDAGCFCDLSGGTECMDGRWGNVLHLKAGEEAAEVERGIGKTVIDEPAAHLTNHIHIIIDTRDDEVGEFYPDSGIAHGKDGVEHGLQVSAADAPVDVVAERLEVDVGGIEIGQQVGQWLLADVACRNEDVPEACLVCKAGGVGDVFYIGKRLGVGVGDARTVVFPAEADYLLRREAVAFHLVGGCLRDVVVLTVQTTEIAAGAGYGQARGARMEVVERLLFYRVDGQCTGPGIDLTDKHTATVATATATSRPAVGNATVVRTELTLHPSVVHTFIISALETIHNFYSFFTTNFTN